MRKSILQKKNSGERLQDKCTQCAEKTLSNVKFISFTNCFPKIQLIQQQNLQDQRNHRRNISKYQGLEIELNSRIFLLHKIPQVSSVRKDSQQIFTSRRSDMNTSRLPDIKNYHSSSIDKLKLVIPRQKTQTNEILESSYQQSVLKGLKESIRSQQSLKIKRKLISQELGVVRKLSLWSNKVLQKNQY